MIDRRAVLRGACACVAVAACGRRGATDHNARVDTDDAAPTTCDDTGTSVDGWVEVPLSAYPELAEVGGHAIVDDDDALLHVIVAQHAPDCFSAVWRVCTHGACELGWNAEVVVAECPCHGSRFATDGHIVRGPATRPVRAFPVVRRGDSLWIGR